MRLLFCAAAILYFSSTVFAAEPAHLAPTAQSAADAELVRTILYCGKAGISVGFQFDGGECVTSSGERKSFGMITLGGLEAQAQTAIIVVYSAKGESINGLYGGAKGLSLGLVGAGSKVRFGSKRKIREPNIRLAGRATLYSFGIGVGYTVQNGGQMWIDDAETAP